MHPAYICVGGSKQVAHRYMKQDREGGGIPCIPLKTMAIYMAFLTRLI